VSEKVAIFDRHYGPFQVRGDFVKGYDISVGFVVDAGQGLAVDVVNVGGFCGRVGLQDANIWQVAEADR